MALVMLCVCCLQTVNEDGSWKDISPEEQQQLDELQRALLENIRSSGEQHELLQQ
jgi:predicted Fe-S protein YdhL (DUF1289 family)